MASAAGKIRAIHGRLDGEGRLIAADAELESLQRDAGAKLGQQLAIPQIAAIARLASELGTSVLRPALAASADEDIEMWVRAKPDGKGGVELALEDWRARPAAGPRLGPVLNDGDSEGVVIPTLLEWSADEGLRVIALSGEFARLLGIDPASAAGVALTRLVQLEENDEGEMPLIGALAARRGFTGQKARLRNDDSTAITLGGDIVTSADGGFAGFRGHAELEETRRAGSADDDNPASFDQTLDELLRDPLDRIIETADRIVERADGPLRGDYASYGNDIAAAAKHLSSVIRGMGAGADDGRRDDPGATITVDLTALAAEAVMMVEPAADERKVTVELEVNRPHRALGQEGAIIQILVNLMGNAVRYSEEGGRAMIRFSSTDGTVSLSVCDEGRGIEPADQERIFERFERADEGGSGTGLGLAISRRLARSMGGDISLESTPGEGATFTLTLPAA